MEIESHEFIPRPFNSELCNECYHRKQHPIHTVHQALGLSEPVWVLESDDRRECLHESFDCSGPGSAVRHRCTSCNLAWTNVFSSSHFVYCDVCQPPLEGFSFDFITKDSGKREEYDSGMQRDTQDGKPRFDLLYPVGIPYNDQFLTRVAELLARGAEKYSERNWEKALGQEELDRFKASALRHMIQWYTGEIDEDHASACVFNLLGAETLKWKLEHGSET